MTAPFWVETVRTAANRYAHGWDERNGGNISLLLRQLAGQFHLTLRAGFLDA